MYVCVCVYIFYRFFPFNIACPLPVGSQGGPTWNLGIKAAGQQIVAVKYREGALVSTCAGPSSFSQWL